MRVRLKGLNSATKRLADGTQRTYWYAWRGGPLLRGEPGSPEFVASYNEAVATKIAPPKGVLLALLFRFQESAEFQHGISERTRRDYIKQIKRIERDFGDFPIKALEDPRSTSVFLEWRDKLAQSAAASRLCLRHLGTRTLLGEKAQTDRGEPVRQWRQAVSR